MCSHPPTRFYPGLRQLLLQLLIPPESEQNVRDCLRGAFSEMARMLLAFHMHTLGLIFQRCRAPAFPAD